MKLLTEVGDLQVVASGSNANGEWIKLGNGTLTQYGNVSMKNDDFLTFPAEFVDENYSFLGNSTYRGRIVSYSGANKLFDKIQIRIWNTENNTYETTSHDITYIAIGKWK